MVLRAVVATALLLASGAASGQDFPSSKPAEPIQYRVFDPPPSTVTCQNGTARLRRGDAPVLAPDVIFVSPVGGGKPTVTPEHAFSFDVTTEGRPVSIRRQPPGARSFLQSGDTLMAELALYAFEPPRVALAGCSIRFLDRLVPATAMSPVLARRLSQVWSGGAAADDLRARAFHPGADCAERLPRPKVRHYPDTKMIRHRPGGLDWVQVRFDVDTAGETVAVAVDGSSGNATLDLAATRAIEASTFHSGPAEGCWVHLGLPPTTLKAPSKPATATFKKPGDSCKNSTVQKVLQDAGRYYPEPFRRRGLEGWAVLRFDIAPWGAMGPVEVLAAQPAEAFGAAAERLARTAKFEAGEGAVGCVLPVSFVLGDPASRQPGAPAASDD